MTGHRRESATRKPFDVERFLSHDHEYCRLVVQEHGAFVLQVCRSYAQDGDHVSDLYQEVWLRVYSKARSYRSTGSFRAWLGRLARNACVSDYRSRRVAAKGLERYAREQAGADPERRIPDPFEDRKQRVLYRAILEAIDDLPKRERQALTLRVIDEKTPREVAGIMRVTPATVRSHIRHGLRRLRERIADPDDALSALALFRSEP